MVWWFRATETVYRLRRPSAVCCDPGQAHGHRERCYTLETARLAFELRLVAAGSVCLASERTGHEADLVHALTVVEAIHGNGAVAGDERRCQVHIRKGVSSRRAGKGDSEDLLLRHRVVFG
jgi:hypothetical protein